MPEEGDYFTRSRSYKKNDSAYVEQKNWSGVRRLVGYDIYNSRGALEQLNRLYQLVRLYTNLYQPVMQLQQKTRHGARVYKVYDSARTPYRRLLESGVLTPEVREVMADSYHDRTTVIRFPAADLTETAELEILRDLALRDGEDFKSGAIYDEEAGEGARVGVAEWFTHRKRGLLVPFGIGLRYVIW